MSRYDTGWSYPNFADRPIDPSTAYTTEACDRLRAIRTAVDPGWLMVASHPISPRDRAA